jgi:hypothetical protein
VGARLGRPPSAVLHEIAGRAPCARSRRLSSWKAEITPFFHHFFTIVPVLEQKLC